MQERDFHPPPPLDERSRLLRRLILGSLQHSGRGHPGSALSIVEILRVLYDDIMHYDPATPHWPERDRCILSKGHGCLALYAILADKGFFPATELSRFCAVDSPLGGHPELDMVPGIEASTGALGHGLSMGAGMALGARLHQRRNRVFVILGDGELNEGSVWEAAMFAKKHRLSNLVAIVDHNKLQSYGMVSEVLDMHPLPDKWRSFGFAVREVDGHNVTALQTLLGATPFVPDTPSVIIAHTVKGKGIPMAEGNPQWHHKSLIKPEELVDMFRALEVE
ncbi:MAG: transketolase [Magnetococcales bacterium]|nr:transketolase [Magnetococcales bacterium]